METVLAICLGLGLAASCGFRIFVPMLLLSLISKTTDLVTLSDGFAWVDSWTAVTVFSVATVLEIAAYYIPWVDNALDSVSTPSAFVAGILTSAAVLADMDPMMKWSLALIAGGGSAGVIKSGTTALRAVSTTTTAGVANPIMSTVEWIVSAVLSLLSIFVPILAAIVAVILVVVLIRFAWRLWKRFRKEPESADVNSGGKAKL